MPSVFHWWHFVIALAIALLIDRLVTPWGRRERDHH
jgi:hypothetical protein